MTLGEKQTEAAAKAALSLLGEDERIAVEAWIDDRERSARSHAATTATGIAGARTFGGVTGIAVLGCLLLYGFGVFERPPKGCPVCPAPKECPPEREALTWRYVNGATRYASTATMECAAVGDVTMCAPVRTPPANPQQITP